MGILLTRGADGLPRRGFDLDEITRMIEIGVLDPDEKFEMIDGEIVPMSPQTMPHVLWRMRLMKALIRLVADDVGVAPEATLTLSRRPARTFETDILLFRPRPDMTEISPADVCLAIEIADTTLDRDVLVKAPRYGEAGVVELWVLDLNARVTHVHRAPTSGGYEQSVLVPFDVPLAPLFADFAITLADLPQ